MTKPNTVPEKLPKHIKLMVEKNNFVSAIKTLASDENISMDAAKQRIDAYEAFLTQQRQTQQANISKKQQTDGSDGNNAFDSLNTGLNQHLANEGYKKPIVPYWVWRLLAILLILCAIIAAGYWLIVKYVF